MKQWIDFKELRSQLDFERVLRHYLVTVQRRGNQHVGFCPLPKHQGKRNSPSFSANLERGIFQCFGCGAKGNLLDFAAAMEGVSPEDNEGLRRVALDLQRQFAPVPSSSTPEATMEPPKGEAVGNPIIINPPLDFELQGLDASHPYLLGRGLLPETIRKFGLGFCGRGFLKGRLAIPLHDQQGRLIGYAGRVVDDTSIHENNPKYLFPSKRHRNGKTLEFRKSRFVYNGFRIASPVSDLIVVEGFASVWWLTQVGFPHCVAVMGADCSEKQAALITELVRVDGRAWIIPDGDPAGERLAQSLLTQLSPHRFIKWVKLGKDQQPTDLQAEQLKSFIVV